MLLPGPKPQTFSRCRAAGAASALVRICLRNAFHQQGVDAPVGVVPRDPGQPGINHEPHPVNRDGCLSHVGRDHNFGPVIPRHRRILVARRQFPVQWQDNISFRLRCAPDRFNGLGNFKPARHEHQHIPLTAAVDKTSESVCRRLPHRRPILAGTIGQVLNLHRKRPTGGGQDRARRQIFLQLLCIQRGRHNRQQQIRPIPFLLVERPRQRDVAVKMTLMKLVKKNGRHPAQLRILDHLPKQHPLRHKPDTCLCRGDILKPDLVTHLFAQFDPQLRRHPRGQ